MQRFTDLFHELDASNRTTSKLAALKRYFSEAPAEDAAWAVFFLTGNRLKRPIRLNLFREWGSEACGYPSWMLDECYDHVGDLAETLSLLITSRQYAQADSLSVPLHEMIEARIQPLREMEVEAQKAMILATWAELDAASCFVFNKLITGGFRVGVSKTLVNRALAEMAGIDAAVMAHRLMGVWQPSAAHYKALFEIGSEGQDPARPYPFCLAYPLEYEATSDLSVQMGAVSNWQIEWKWDGIRAQLIKRGNQPVLWSRGEEMLGEQFPEIMEAVARLRENLVLDGEVLVWDFEAERAAPFAQLQRRLGRTKVGPKLRKEAPVIFMVYDVPEYEGEDLRVSPTAERRARLEELSFLNEGVFRRSPLVVCPSWEAVAEARLESRERGVEGLMLKLASASYVAGRKKGEWWKWKVDPYTVDAVMVYAQQGHGRRAGLYTDYTFSIWDGEVLVPFAKAYSGLSDAEIRRVDRWIRSNTIDKHGPVRVVRPELVFEIAFEGISESKRHKSGIAVRFPRMHRWREDKPASEADSLDSVRALLAK
ncbi:MAG: ATP-dependent DNA ligase [Verrucomicrobiota bacterium]